MNFDFDTIIAIVTVITLVITAWQTVILSNEAKNSAVAYIQCTAKTLHNFASTDHIVEICCEIKNTGTNVALDVSTIGTLALVNYDPKSRESPPSLKEDWSSGIAYFPGETRFVNYSLSRLLHEDDVEKLINQDIAIGLRVKIRYKDIYNRNHRTEIFVIVNGTKENLRSLKQKNHGEFRFNVARLGNLVK